MKNRFLFLITLPAALLAHQGFASNCWIRPANPVSGQTVTVTYDKSGGPLANAAGIRVHRAANDWSFNASPDQEMSLDPATKLYTFSCTAPEAAYVLNYAFHDAASTLTWDNNHRANWNFPVTPGKAPPPLPDPPALPLNASKAHVMMQGFYWDVPTGGIWYDTMASKAAELRNMMGGQGIDRIWFPPPSKGAYGINSMGYDPYDYYDLGTYNQGGGIRTRFGTQSQLKNAIDAYKAQGIVCMADIVLNHRVGGRAESNPNRGGATTWTDFSRVLSGKCTWHFNQFHPSTFEVSDEGAFKDFPDVCQVTGDQPGSARYDLLQWGRWLTDPNNTGFDGGWRFDFVKGYPPSFTAAFRAGTGNAFGVGECWDGNVANLDAYVRVSAGMSAFDFPGYFTLRDLFNSTTGAGNLANLVDSNRVYAARNPSRAVTFCANHDTDEIKSNKMLAYAFILTYQGYPCIFWKDYFDAGLAALGGQAGNGIKRLVWVRGSLGGGDPRIQPLKTDDANLLVYGTLNGSAGAPGYIAAINDDPVLTKSDAVTTGNRYLWGKTLQCYAWYSYATGSNIQPANATCSPGGSVTVQAPPRGYAVYGPVGYGAP